MSRSSDFFKNYIERGLKFIEEKKRKELAQGLLTPDNNNPVEDSPVQQSSGSESGVNPDAYRERLKKLRALAGLETSQVRFTAIRFIQIMYSKYDFVFYGRLQVQMRAVR